MTTWLFRPYLQATGSTTMLMTGLSGNEIYCLAQKGFGPGNIVVGNSVHSLGFVRGITSGLKTLSGGEIRSITAADRRRPPRRDQPARTGGEGRGRSRAHRRRLGSEEAQRPDGVHRDRIIGEERESIRPVLLDGVHRAGPVLPDRLRATSPGIS